jgi:universal stress protein F
MNRILTCLDSSPRAVNVLATAVALAKKTGAKLVLFRSVGLDPELRYEIMGITPNEALDRVMAHTKSDLDAIAATVPPEVLDRAVAHVGTPWDAICREARKLDCDLIVIGSHGYAGIDRLLGTTAGKVVNHADCSVLVVR